MFHYGHHVMMDPTGQWAVLGTMRDDHAGFDAGAAHVFALSGGTFVHVTKLTASDAGPNALFGRTVAIEGDTILVGAHRHDAEQGNVYYYHRDDNGTPADPLDDTWPEVQKLGASDGLPDDHFGLGLSLEGNKVAIGANGDEVNGKTSGSVYIFERVGGVWVEGQKITPPEALSGDEYGACTLLRGNRLFVGAVGRDENAVDTGAVYTYQLIQGIFLPNTKLIANDAVADWFQGEEVSLDLDGDVLLTTAWGASTLTGAAYAFQLPRWYCTGKLNTAGCVPVMSYAGEHASTVSPLPYSVSAALIVPNQVGIMIYSTNGEASIPFQGGILCIGSPVIRTPGQFSGGVPPPPACSGKYNFNFNAWIQSGIDPNLVVGATVNAQYWYRDPTHPVNGSGLTNAVEFMICE
jgi:hypothetical protein